MHILSRMRRPNRSSFRPILEALESRFAPATFMVSSLDDAGAGTLRQAITNANSTAGADVIDFSIAGTIQLTSAALPVIADSVTIDGKTAPGFSTAPVVELDANGFAGLVFNLGSASSKLASLSIVDAAGAGVTLNDSSITVVGSYIGVALGGSTKAANTGAGLVLSSSMNDTIGGTAATDRNVISGNGGDGIDIDGTSSGNTVINNRIGTNASGNLSLGNLGNGITITGSGNTIGGSTAGMGNTIAFNSQSGVVVQVGAGNAILSNAIFNNGDLGISLASNGNLNQPAPVLTFASVTSGTTVSTFTAEIGGTLTAKPNATYTIQVFANPSPVPGVQGQVFLGTVTATTNASGVATFALKNATLSSGAGTTFTATATDASNNTSMFSASIGESTTNQVFVANVYQLLLNRSPDSGFSFWVDALNNGATPGSVIRVIEGSTEYLNDQIATLYRHYLNRAPDSTGAQFWTNFLITGGTLEQLAEGLVDSNEYFTQQGGTNSNFLQALYTQVLNRAPGATELNFWLAALNAGPSRSNVSVSFLTSTEYRTSLVQNAYTTYLHRSVDIGGLEAWLALFEAGATDQDVVAGIFGSPEGYGIWSA